MCLRLLTGVFLALLVLPTSSAQASNIPVLVTLDAVLLHTSDIPSYLQHRWNQVRTNAIVAREDRIPISQLRSEGRILGVMNQFWRDSRAGLVSETSWAGLYKTHHGALVSEQIGGGTNYFYYHDRPGYRELHRLWHGVPLSEQTFPCTCGGQHQTVYIADAVPGSFDLSVEIHYVFGTTQGSSIRRGALRLIKLMVRRAQQVHVAPE